jgi:hypothetical protein
MRLHLAINRLCLVFLLSLSTACASRAPRLVETDLDEVTYRRSIQAAIAHSTPTEASEMLSFSSDSTTRAALAWLRAVAVLPSEPSERRWQLDSAAVERFLGVLEVCIGCPIPQGWQASLRAGTTDSNGCVLWPAALTGPTALGLRHTQEGLAVARTGDMLRVDGKAVRLLVPISSLPFTDARMLTGVVVGGTVVLMDASMNQSSNLVCLDATSGHLRWTTQLGMLRDGRTGAAPMDICLPVVVASNGNLHFFGINEYGAYAISRDATTGCQTFYFSTAPLCAIESARPIATLR